MTGSIYDNSIVLPLSGSGTTDDYAQFEVSILRQPSVFNPAAYAVVYTGKTWIDGNGATTIYVGDIMKDVAFTVRETYNATEQCYRPASGSALIEVEPMPFLNTKVKVSFPNSEYADTEMFLCSFRTPRPSLQQNSGILNPYDTTVGFFALEGYVTGVMPRLPAINTTHCYCGCLVATYPAAGTTLRMTEGTNDFTLLNTRRGNVIAVYSMAELFTLLPAISLVGDTELKVYNSGDVSTTQTVAVVEYCYKSYYLQWWDINNEFHSRGMVKNATVGVDNGNADYYTNINTGKSVVENAPRNTWTLNSGNIAKNEYYDLLTLFSAQLVYLYDTDRDMRYKVVVQGSTGQYANRMRNAAKNFTVNLIEA